MASVTLDDIKMRQFRDSRVIARGETSAFDEDLWWILESFTGRMMAEGGVITHHRGGGAASTIATARVFGRDGSVPQDLLQAAIAVADANVRRMHGPDPLVVWCCTTLEGGSGRAILLPATCANGEQVVIAAVYRDGASVTAKQSEQIAAQLYPMLGGYFRLWGKARAQSRFTAALEKTLDASPGAVAVLDRAGEVRFLNRAMRRLAEQGDGLRLRGRTLVASDATGSMRLQIAIGQVLADDTSAAREPNALALFLERPNKRGLLPIAVLGATFAPWEVDDAAVVVFAIDPAADLVGSIRPLCHSHGLSPVEASLVQHLVAGETLAEAADSIRVKEQTARAYLKQVFGKTGVSRQSELIRLMLTNALRVNCALIHSRS